MPRCAETTKRERATEECRNICRGFRLSIKVHDAPMCSGKCSRQISQSPKHSKNRNFERAIACSIFYFFVLHGLHHDLSNIHDVSATCDTDGNSFERPDVMVPPSQYGGAAGCVRWHSWRSRHWKSSGSWLSEHFLKRSVSHNYIL